MFRLQADGLERTYQIDIGCALWKLPCDMTLEQPVEQLGWLEQLGPKGPWVAERHI